MHWQSQAIVINVIKHGESSAIVDLFTAEHGRHGGMFKGAFSKSRRGVAMVGNVVNATWSGRLEGQLGNWGLELQTPVAASVMAGWSQLQLLQSLCALLKYGLSDKYSYPRLYDATLTMCELLMAYNEISTAQLLGIYSLWERLLLKEFGYRLDLSECAATADVKNLIFISPKSGRAVSESAGQIYKDKMLPLPPFFLNYDIEGSDNGIGTEVAREFFKQENNLQMSEALDACKVTGYFLNKWLFNANGKALPVVRERLLEHF